MNRTLKRLFDYQRFENDSRLGGMIRETETRMQRVFPRFQAWMTMLINDQ